MRRPMARQQQAQSTAKPSTTATSFATFRLLAQHSHLRLALAAFGPYVPECLMAVSLQFGLCLGNGLLTVDSIDQAEARAAADGYNKGAEAAAAALLQIAAARRLGAV